MAAVIVFSILLTFAAAQILTANRKSVPIDRVISMVRNDMPAQGADSLEPSLLALIQNGGNKDVASLANQIAAGRSPYELVAISEFLIVEAKAPRAAEIGAVIAENGADLYGDANLLHRAGVENYLGRHVPKDYQRAQKYLENPLLRFVPYSQYFLGELLAAGDNPNRDLALAIDRLQFAADKGVTEAKQRLQQLSPLAN